MKRKSKFQTFYCPKCERNTKHKRVDDITVTPEKNIVFDGWICKRCGRFVELKEAIKAVKKLERKTF